MEKKLKIWLAAVSCLVLVLLVIVIATAATHDGNDGSNGQPAAVGQSAVERTTKAAVPKTENPPIPIELSVLSEEGYNSIYSKKIVEVKGKVTRFYNTDRYGFRIQLGDLGESNITCYFSDPNEIAKLAELYENSHVIIIGRYDPKSLYHCTVEMEDGTEIELTTGAPPIKDGICEITVEEFKAMERDLDLGRNDIRADVLLQEAKIKITAKVIRKWHTNRRILRDNAVICIGNYAQDIECYVGSWSAFDSISEGDTVTVLGDFKFYRDGSVLNSAIITKTKPQ